MYASIGADKHCTMFECDSCAIASLKKDLPIQLGYTILAESLVCRQCEDHALKMRRFMWRLVFGLKNDSIKKLWLVEKKVPTRFNAARNSQTREAPVLKVCRSCRSFKLAKEIDEACVAQTRRYYPHREMGFVKTGPTICFW